MLCCLRRLPVLAALLWWALLPCACKRKGPDQSRPFVVVLDEAATHSAAAARAEELARSNPETLDGSTALSVIAAPGLQRHLVVGPAYASEQEAQKLARSLAGTCGARLEVISIVSLRLASGDELDEISTPEEAELMEKLAAALPAPTESLLLRSFMLLKDPGSSGRYRLGSFGRAGPGEWSREFGKLGWRASAEALYRSPPGQSGGAEARVFVGWLAPGSEGQGAISRVQDFLLKHRSPTPEEREKIEKQRLAERRRKMAERTSRLRRRRGKPPPPPPQSPQPVEQPELPPAPIFMALPWGLAQVVAVPRIALIPAEKTVADTRLYDAWIALMPGEEALFLVLQDDHRRAGELLQPRSLGKPCGLVHSLYLTSAWRKLPEATISGEELALLGMDRFAVMLDAKMRRENWAEASADLPIVIAGYSSGSNWWNVRFAEMSSETIAEGIFDAAFVDPRRERLQQMYKSRRQVSYDMGVTLQEVGEVMGWHFKGAAEGSIQELYFRTNATLWLLQANQARIGGMQPSELLARVDLLQIWRKPVQ